MKRVLDLSRTGSRQGRQRRIEGLFSDAEWRGLVVTGDGKKMDPVRRAEFLRSIRTLTATKFASDWISLSGAFSDGHRSRTMQARRRVDIAKKAAKAIIWQREADGTALFVVDVKAVDDIQKAADGLQTRGNSLNEGNNDAHR